MLNNLHESLGRLNPSPFPKYDYCEHIEKQRNLENSPKKEASPEKIKGKRHYANNQNYIGSYRMEHQNYFQNTNDRISHFIRYYNEINEREKFLLNPDPVKIKRNLDNIREVKNDQKNLSPDNPYFRTRDSRAPEEYIVMKFSQKSTLNNSNIKTNTKKKIK